MKLNQEFPVGKGRHFALWTRWVLRMACLGLAVFVLAYLCAAVPRHADQVAPIWLANAAVLTGLLCSRRRRWPVIAAVGAFAILMANFAMGFPLTQSVGFAAANAVEFIAAGLALSRLGRRPFDRWRAGDCLQFGGVSLAVAAASAALGAGVLSINGATPSFRDFLLWTLADALGLLILTPCLLILARSRGAVRAMGREAIFPFVILVASATLSFGQSRYPIQFLPAVGLLFVAWRLRATGAAIGLLVLDAIAVPLTMAGYGPFTFAGSRLHQPMLAVQTYMALCFFIAVPVAAQSARVRRMHKDLRTALTASREEARKVAMAKDVAKLGYWRFEVATQAVTWSPLMFDIFDLDPAKPLDFEMAMGMIHPADREKSRIDFENALATGEGFDDDLVRINTPGGELRYAGGRTVTEKNAQGVVTAVFGVLYDKTEAVRTDHARREAETRYRMLAENATDLIMQIDLDRRFSYVSPSAYAITGYSQAEVIGGSPETFLDPRDNELVAGAFHRQITSGGKSPPERIEYRITAKDGRELWLESRPIALIDPVTGQCMGVSDVARDITARRQLEADLRLAREQAEAAAQVKSEFLANMSHELRTPLTSVIGFTRLAAEQPELSVLTRDYVDRVNDASRALLCTVNDILDFSKLEAGQVVIHRESASPVKLARSTLGLFLPQAGAKDLDLVLDCDLDEGLCLDIDADRIRQVLLNLVGNAVKFTAQGQVTLSLGYADGRLSAAVRDTGDGIAPERQSLLFQRFSQIDGSLTRAHGGTGLGLAICKGLIEAMGGEISVESAPGKGSTFKFDLPATIVAAATASVDGASQATAVPGVRVLVVDDHAANRELANLFLAGLGAEVFEAADGLEAVDLAARWPFDVILLDLRMPKMDGPAVLAAIRAQPGPNDATPILAFTADADEATTAGLARLGFQGLVAKPLEPAALLEAVIAATTFEIPTLREPAVVH